MVNLKFEDYKIQKYSRICNFRNGLAPVENNDGLWGFIDKTGKEVITCQYQDVEYFSEGLAAVRNENNEYGYINTQGELVISHQYSFAGEFKEGKAVVSSRNSYGYGYIDKNGKPIIKEKYGSASEFQEGYGIVKLRGKHNESYYINPNGTLIGPYELISPFYKGIAFMVDSKNIYTINKEFQVINQMSRSNTREVCHCAEGIIKVKNLCGMYEYIDSNLNKITPVEFEKAYGFSNGMAVVNLDKKYYLGIINQEGRIIAFSKDYQYQSIDEFKEGCASVQDPNGNYGFINQEGKEIIPCQYQEVGDFSEGLAWVLDEDDNFYYIDKTGTKKISISRQYHSTLELDDQVIHLEAKSKQALQAEKLRVLAYVKDEVLEKVANAIDQLVYTETSGLYIEGKTRRKTPQNPSELKK